MNKLFKTLTRADRFQDAAGVVRGILKVNSQILKRTDHLSVDIQRFYTNLENDLEFISDKIEDANDFLKTATKTFETPVGEITYFEAEEFDYEKEMQLLEEEESLQINTAVGASSEAVKADSKVSKKNDNRKEMTFGFISDKQKSDGGQNQGQGDDAATEARTKQQEVDRKEEELKIKQMELDLGKYKSEKLSRSVVV